MQINGATLVIRLLEEFGIQTVTGIPGGANLPLYDALHRSSISHILARHEQGAGFISHGMARTSGEIAVTFATSGPGATNLLTAIADAQMDSVPLVAITGQVGTSMIGTDAFQEVDTYGMSLPVTKHNFLIRKADDILETVTEAFRLAGEGRPGAVLIDIPKDVQNEIIEIDETAIRASASTLAKEKNSDNILEDEIIQRIGRLINDASRPVILAGGGVIIGEGSMVLTAIAEKNTIPVATTLMGLGSFSPLSPLYLGLLGMHGLRSTNQILQEADLVIALGVRFGDRTTGKIDQFCPDASVIHIDVDEAEISKIKECHYSVKSDVASALAKIEPMITANDRNEWTRRIDSLRGELDTEQPTVESLSNPKHLIESVSTMVDHDAIITTDVGQHQMWVAQYYPFRHPRTWLTSGGLGTMGFGLPAAIGAAVAAPEKKIICFSGDGSLLMNIQELATLGELRLDVKIILLNNSNLGLVRQQQHLFFEKRYAASSFVHHPDFVALGSSFGIPSFDLKENDHKILKDILDTPGPALIHIAISPEEMVFPMVPPGGENSQSIGGVA